jgi:hypothetical protein
MEARGFAIIRFGNPGASMKESRSWVDIWKIEGVICKSGWNLIIGDLFF